MYAGLVPSWRRIAIGKFVGIFERSGRAFATMFVTGRLYRANTAGPLVTQHKKVPLLSAAASGDGVHWALAGRPDSRAAAATTYQLNFISK